MQEARPQKAPFRVAYEIYSNPRRRYLTTFAGKLAREEMRPARDFLDSDMRESATEQDALTYKTYRIGFFKENVPTLQELAQNEATERRNYLVLKGYFEEKIARLGLVHPLIFFDDNAMRIDVGYGPREFGMFFKDLDKIIKSKKITRIQNSSMNLMGNTFLNDNEEYREFLNYERERLTVKLAEITESKLPVKVMVNLDEQVVNEKELLKKLFEQGRGIVIGEKHTHESARAFLVDNMAFLKELGVTQIYMEHLLQERHQTLLDLSEMPDELNFYLKYLDKEHDMEEKKASFTQIIQVAKENGIRVIAIDSEASYGIGFADTLAHLEEKDEETAQRFAVMNMSALECFKKYDDGKRYVTFTGSGHIASCYGVIGLSEVLGCPNLVIQDFEEEDAMKGKLETQVDYVIDEKHVVHFDFLYQRSRISEEFEQQKSLTLSRKML